MKPEDGLPSDCMPSLPDMLRPVKVGMLSAAGLCAALAACLTGMVPIEARMALMLNDILDTSFTCSLAFCLLCVRLESSR